MSVEPKGEPTPAFVTAFNEGLAAHQAGLLAQAAAAFRTATAIEPTHPLALNNLGSVLKAQGQFDAAAEAFRRAIALDPHMAMAYSNLGSALMSLDRYDDALAVLERAVRLEPDYPEALNNRAICLLELGRLEDANADVERVIALKPDYAEAHTNHGAVLAAMGETDLAIRAFERAVTLMPGLAMAHKNWGLALLRNGDYRAGWREYAWRWQADGLPPRNYPRPLWQGGPVRGKTVLLYAEQGLGDAIQFARFVPYLAEQGARVILEVHEPLVPLMRSLAGVSDVVPLGAPPQDFDAYNALMSVPGVLGLTPETVPCPTPYLAAEPERVAVWRKKIGEHGFKVGIVWEGKTATPSQRTRSVPLEMFAPLAAVPGVRLISLQKGDDLPAETVTVESLGAAFDQGGAFLDAAAVMKSLDLVISVDTAIAHLAGALGVPLWIAVKHAADWRYGSEGSAFPWYPSARLFRQAKPGTWQPVFAGIAEALKQRLRGESTRLVTEKTHAHPAAARDFSRFDRFLTSLSGDVYPETPAEPHISIISTTIETLHRDGFLKAGERVLDVGCGQGQALRHFRELGLRGTGIAMGADVDICRGEGLDVIAMDQNFMDFADGVFDVLWCRHVLEHSVAPLFTLTEYRRLTKPGGLIYVEVPAPDTAAHHERGPNHYSLLPMSAWAELFRRAGCRIERSWAIDFTVPAGPDTYWSFLLRRPG